MKTLDLKSLLIGALLTMLIVAFMLITTTSSAPRAWEYRHVTSGAGGSTVVSKLGDEGWEVVGYTYARHPTGQGSDFSYYVLKRPKRSNWSWKFWK